MEAIGSGSAIIKLFGNDDRRPVGCLQIEVWGDTTKNWSPEPYDWAVRLTVPGGGLVESTNYFGFVAPESGYQESMEIVMKKDRSGWSDTVGKWLFFKLPGGYARMPIHIRARTPLYVSLEYYYNPDGQTNLEHGPQMPPDGPWE